MSPPFSVKRPKTAKKNVQDCILFMLPTELMPLFMVYLTIRERVRLSQTCKYAFHIIWENSKRTRLPIWRDIIGSAVFDDKRKVVAAVIVAYRESMIIKWPIVGCGPGAYCYFSIDKCAKFGFHHMQRIKAPYGRKGVVIGERNGELWFHLDGDYGACYCGDSKTREEFASWGYIPCEREPEFKGPQVIGDWK